MSPMNEPQPKEILSQRLLLAVAVVLAAVVIGLALLWHPEPPARDIPKASVSGGDFVLQGADGQVGLADYRGKVVLLYFGYTYCPDICPTALTATAAALKSMTEAERARVATLFISVDPERDTPAHLKEYAAFFDPSIVGITGSADQIAAVARQYGVFYAKQKTDTAGGYVVDHTSETYVVGPDGKLASRLPHGAAPERVAAEVRRLLQ